MGRPIWLTLHFPVIWYFNCAIKMWYCDFLILSFILVLILTWWIIAFSRFVCDLVKIAALVFKIVLFVVF